MFIDPYSLAAIVASSAALGFLVGIISLVYIGVRLYHLPPLKDTGRPDSARP
jgi:hypothetical protein